MSSENNGAQAGLKIGRTLELARKESGLSLKQVEQATKIRTRYLRELERENFDVLPSVYVQGSLKTYANFLGLDGEALTRELKRRQPPDDESEAPTQIELPKNDFDRAPIYAGGAAGTGEIAQDGEDAGATAVPGGNIRLYLSSAAFLVLILVAVALALTLPKGNQPAVSQVHEPLISQAPSEVSRVGGEGSERAQPLKQQTGDEQSKDDKSAGPQPKQPIGPSDDAAQNGGPPAQTGQEESGIQLAQGPGDAQSNRFAPPAAETATAEPEATPAPTANQPAPTTTQPAPTATQPAPTASQPVPTATQPAPTTTQPMASEAPVQDDQTMIGGVRIDGPADQDGTLAMKAGGVEISSGPGGGEVRVGHGKRGRTHLTGSTADDEDNARSPLP